MTLVGSSNNINEHYVKRLGLNLFFVFDHLIMYLLIHQRECHILLVVLKLPPITKMIWEVIQT